MQLSDLRIQPELWSVLEERARQLARPASQHTLESDEVQLVFRRGEEIYGLPAHAILEVQPLGGYTPLPFTPACIIGLINVRGRLVSLLDIRPLFGLPTRAPAASACAIILAASGAQTALLADDVIEVRPNDPHLLRPLTASSGEGTLWVLGIDHQQALIIDPLLLLNDPRIRVCD
jgi:purine-binding chemotaxis protein CheW